MTTSIEEEVNYTSLIELFGTFFEKVTNSHPQKDGLNKHLSEFKRMLYTNKSNLQTVETYLDDLRKKIRPPSQQTAKTLAYDQSSLPPDSKKISLNTDFARSLKRYKTFGPDSSRGGTKSHKFETVSTINFIKNRSLEHSNQKQSLLSKYSHIHEFELDSSNFYRLIAVGQIMHLISISNSDAKLAEIAEDVASNKIILKNYYYSYSHIEYANVFCGYIEQILAAKKEGKDVQGVLQLFQDMVKYDHLFNIALLCYLKGKLIQFVTEQLPKGAWSSQTAWDQLHSPDITEKILNNNPMIFESLLNVLPFLLDLRIVTQITENGALNEKGYSKKAFWVTDAEADQSSDNEPIEAIHLLVEKIFTTSNFYLLAPVEPDANDLNLATEAQANHKLILDDIKQKYSKRSAGRSATSAEVKTTLDSARVEKQNADQTTAVAATAAQTKDLRFEPLNNVLADRVNTTPEKQSTTNLKSPRYFMTPSRLRGSDVNIESLKDAPCSEKKQKTTEYSEIVSGSLAYQLERSHGKENKLSFEKKSPQRRKETDVKDFGAVTSVLENRASLNSSSTPPQSSSSRNSGKEEALYPIKQNESEVTELQNQKPINPSESPYDLYIKSRNQQTATTRPSLDDKTTAAAVNPRAGSFVYSGNPFNSTPYDNYVSSHNYSTQSNASSTRYAYLSTKWLFS